METCPHIIKFLGFNYTIEVFNIGTNNIKLLQVDYLVKAPINIMASP